MNYRSLIQYAFLFLMLFGCAEAPKQVNVSELSITQIHDAYRAGQFNSQDLTAAYLDRIKTSNAAINAITFINPLAMNRAKEMDEEYQKTGQLRPLHGIPVIVKDNINTSGMPTTAGALALQDFIPEEDAFIIKKLKDAGAIILAKSNMAEWAFSPMHTASSTFGTTKNPYNHDFVPAGSSGGTAAAIASNFGSIGLGTDTGNSIRGPSSHCALVGIRPSLGLISRSGIVPLFLRNDVVGPMCRSVADATRLLGVMVGYDSKDEITRYSERESSVDYTTYLKKDGLKGAKIGISRQISAEGIDPEIAGFFDQAIKDMDSLGAEMYDDVIIPDFEELIQNQWCATFRSDVEAFLGEYVDVDTVQTIEDIIRIGTKSDFARQRLEGNRDFSGRWGDMDLECGDAFSDSLRVAFRQAIEMEMDRLGLDAIIYPTWNYKPAHLDAFEEEYRGDNNQLISPHTGQPAITVPMGYTQQNLPTGVQFLGRIFDEAMLIKLAYAYEQGTLHRKPPVNRE